MLWIATYTLVLIGTLRYHYPLISPMTQAIIAPFEFAVLIRFIISGQLDLDYVSVAYVYWSVIEIVIICVILKSGFIKKKHIVPYIVLIGAITCIMYYFVAVKNYIFFFSYFNTFLGEIIWLKYIWKKDYPMKPISLAVFITKFVADISAVLVYLGDGTWIISLLCVLLPILDFGFILVYLRRIKSVK